MQRLMYTRAVRRVLTWMIALITPRGAPPTALSTNV
jgi:hypothetical protein